MLKINKSVIENFLESLVSEKGLSKNTIASYKNDINQFLEKYPNNKKTKKVNLKKIVENYIFLLSDLGFERSTILRKLSSLGHFFDFLVNEKILCMEEQK